MVYNGSNPIKMDDLGVFPLFLETPIIYTLIIREVLQKNLYPSVSSVHRTCTNHNGGMSPTDPTEQWNLKEGPNMP